MKPHTRKPVELAIIYIVHQALSYKYASVYINNWSNLNKTNNNIETH